MSVVYSSGTSGATLNNISISNGGSSTIWTSPPTGGMTVKKRITIEDDYGDKIDLGKAAKMFMWWVQTYHPEIEKEFDAVEDTKREAE